MLLLTLAACSEKPSDPTPSETNLPTREPTPEEKKAAIKNDMLAFFADDDSDTRKSPGMLFDFFEDDFAIKDIQYSKASSSPNSLIHKDNVLYEHNAPSVYYFNGYDSYAFVHKDVAMKISARPNQPTEAATLKAFSSPDDYKPSLLAYFGIDLSVLSDALSEDSDEEDTPKLPTLTADDLTVSDDYTTGTFSEEFLKKLLIAFVDTSKSMTDVEKNTMLSEFEGSGVYTVAEKKMVFHLSAKSKVSGKITLDLVFQDHPTEGITVQVTSTDTIYPPSGIPTLVETSISLDNIKYNGDVPISGSIGMKTKTTVEQKIANVTRTTVAVASATATVNVENKTKPVFSVICQAKEKSMNNGNESTAVGSETKTELSYDPARSEKQLRYSNFKDDGASSSAFQASSENVAFGDAVEAIVIPDRVLACAEENYESCKAQLPQNES